MKKISLRLRLILTIMAEGIYYKPFKKFDLLVKRIKYCEVGFAGHVSMIDENISKEQGLIKLNSFERFLFGPDIKFLKSIHKEAFRKSCIDVLGEDPEDWGI